MLEELDAGVLDDGGDHHRAQAEVPPGRSGPSSASLLSGRNALCARKSPFQYPIIK
jgi:hypothetical protein